MLHPGDTATESLVAGSSFVIRSADLSTRIRVNFDLNEDPDRPFSLGIVNLSVDDRHGPFPVELQHSNSGFVWVDPGEVVTHMTAENHVFTVRDKSKHEVFSVTVHGKNTEL